MTHPDFDFADIGDYTIETIDNTGNLNRYILGIDSSDTISTYADSDVIDLLNDSGVQNILPQLDSTYDLGDSDRRWRDLWLSGNTLHLGLAKWRLSKIKTCFESRKLCVTTRNN